MMNRNGCGRKRSWSNLRRYPGINWEGLRKTTKYLVSIADLQAEISTQGVPNTKQER
jgi:hypothetical protein